MTTKAKQGYGERPCWECGKVFYAKAANKVFCSVTCQREYQKRRNLEKRRREWEENPVYCECCGELVPFGRKKYCSVECQREMKRKLSASYTGEKKIQKKETKKEPGIEGKAKELGMTYGQYKANRGIKPVDIAEKFEAPVYEPEKWLGDKPIQVHQQPPGGQARIKRHVI